MAVDAEWWTRPATGDGRVHFARPQFNSYRPLSAYVLERLDSMEAAGEPMAIATSASKFCMTYPSGVQLGARPIAIPPGSDGEGHPLPDTPASAWSRFHLKGQKLRDAAVGTGVSARELGGPARGSRPEIAAVYFPLLAVVIPEWIRAIRRRALAHDGAPPARKVLVLVSGAGQPRDEHADPADNSTEVAGRIIERWVRAVHKDIEVVSSP